MKLLLDENVPRRLARHLRPPTFAVHTVPGVGWTGIRNGTLIARAARHGYHALITFDRNIAHQQNLDLLPLPVVLIATIHNGIKHIEPHVPELIQLLTSPNLDNTHHTVPRPAT